jgi:AP-2 complex subunit mu-1
MLSAVVLIDRNGEVLAMRRYRRDFDANALDNYRIGVIAAKEAQSCPATVVDGTSFLHIMREDVYYVGMTRRNSSAGAIYEFLDRLPDVLRQVLRIRDSATAAQIKSNAADIVELLDEMIDSGYPQLTDPDALRVLTQRKSASRCSESRVTVMVTRITPWRPQGIRHAKNELFVDIAERISTLVSASGKVLDCAVAGTLRMDSRLSGMPECKIGINDRVAPEDMAFHQCAKLVDFAVTFIPPDGAFELMNYRKTDRIAVPITITPLVRDLPGNTKEIRVDMRSNYEATLAAKPVIVMIPCPDNTASVNVTATLGRAKYVPEQGAVAWKIAGFPGRAQADAVVVVTCLQGMTNAPMRLTAPITVEFSIPMLAPSGIEVRYVTVVEKSGYTPEKWIRYVAKSGKFEVRMV